jgi:hypothetical protein
LFAAASSETSTGEEATSLVNRTSTFGRGFLKRLNPVLRSGAEAGETMFTAGIPNEL